MEHEFIISYKNPKKRNLIYITILSISVSDALKKLPKELVRNKETYFHYGIH